MLQFEIPIVMDFKKGKDIHIKLIGDLHYGSRQFSQKRWDDFKSTITDEDYFICVGDLIDNGTLNAPGASMYEQQVPVGEQKEWLYNELKPYVGRFIACVPGNHELRSKKLAGQDILYDVFCRLKEEDHYRPSMAVCILRFGQKESTNSETRPTYKVVVGHGVGGGMYIGSGANRLERFVTISNADLLISGHTHKPLTFPTSSLWIDTHNKKTHEQPHTVVVCSSFLDYGGYALDKFPPPTAKCFQEITLSANGKAVSVNQITKG